MPAASFGSSACGSCPKTSTAAIAKPVEQKHSTSIDGHISRERNGTLALRKLCQKHAVGLDMHIPQPETVGYQHKLTSTGDGEIARDRSIKHGVRSLITTIVHDQVPVAELVGLKINRPRTAEIRAPAAIGGKSAVKKIRRKRDGDTPAATTATTWQNPRTTIR